jgi:hypothetical protein
MLIKSRQKCSYKNDLKNDIYFLKGNFFTEGMIKIFSHMTD